MPTTIREGETQLRKFHDNQGGSVKTAIGLISISGGGLPGHDIMVAAKEPIFARVDAATPAFDLDPVHIVYEAQTAGALETVRGVLKGLLPKHKGASLDPLTDFPS